MQIKQTLIETVIPEAIAPYVFHLMAGDMQPTVHI